jgi:hypothetical protein
MQTDRKKDKIYTKKVMTKNSSHAPYSGTKTAPLYDKIHSILKQPEYILLETGYINLNILIE